MALIYAPIDNKNIMEDPFEDEVFRDYHAAEEHHWGGRRHLIGVRENATVDVSWHFGSHEIEIEVIAVALGEDFDIATSDVFDSFEKEFSSWQCEDNPGLVVKFKRVHRVLTVSFYFKA